MEEGESLRLSEGTTALTILHLSHFTLPVPEHIELQQNLAPLHKLLVVLGLIALLIRHNHFVAICSTSMIFEALMR